MRKLWFCVVLAVIPVKASEDLRPVYSWNLTTNQAYAMRSSQQAEKLALETPRLSFLNDDNLAVAFMDDRGGFVWDRNAVLKGQPYYKLHALIFNVKDGPASAVELTWDGISTSPQLLPLKNGSFVVRIDNKLFLHAASTQLKREITFPMGDSGRDQDAIASEYFTAGVSVSGKTIVVCHSYREKPKGRHAVITRYSADELSQLGQSLTIPEQCGPVLTATDDYAVIGKTRLDFRTGDATDFLIADELPCKAVPNSPQPLCHSYQLLDDDHVLVCCINNQRQVISQHDQTRYVLKPGPRPYARVDKPVFEEPQPYSANAPLIAYDDGQPYDISRTVFSKQVHIHDWRKRTKVASISVDQNKPKTLHSPNGLSLTRLNLVDFDYALSPNGTYLAVINRDIVTVYKLPVAQ